MIKHFLKVCLILFPLIFSAQNPNVILIEPDDEVICSNSDCFVQHMDFTGTTQSDYIPEGQALDWLVLLDINDDWVYEKLLEVRKKIGMPIMGILLILQKERKLNQDNHFA